MTNWYAPRKTDATYMVRRMTWFSHLWKNKSRKIHGCGVAKRATLRSHYSYFSRGKVFVFPGKSPDAEKKAYFTQNKKVNKTKIGNNFCVILGRIHICYIWVPYTENVTEIWLTIALDTIFLKTDVTKWQDKFIGNAVCNALKPIYV